MYILGVIYILKVLYIYIYTYSRSYIYIEGVIYLYTFKVLYIYLIHSRCYILMQMKRTVMNHLGRHRTEKDLFSLVIDLLDTFTKVFRKDSLLSRSKYFTCTFPVGIKHKFPLH